MSFLIIFSSEFAYIFLKIYLGFPKFPELFREVSILSTDGKFRK